MLTIRKEQMAALAAVAWQKFEDRTVLELGRDQPQRFDELGEAEVRRMVRKSIQRGRQYAFATKRDVRRLAELMVECPDFDDQPRHAWTRELLGRTDIPSGNRMALLVYRMTGRSDSL